MSELIASARAALSPQLLVALTVGSVILFVASVVGVPWFVRRLPPDYFSRREQRRMGIGPEKRSLARLAAVVLKNVVGFVLLLVGFAMLFLPGQGLLTLLAALALLDFPGKKRVQRWILMRPAVLGTLNRMRRGLGEPPIELAPPSE